MFWYAFSERGIILFSYPCRIIQMKFLLLPYDKQEISIITQTSVAKLWMDHTALSRNVTKCKRVNHSPRVAEINWNEKEGCISC